MKNLIGYSVFVVKGEIPFSDADKYAELHPKPENKNNLSNISYNNKKPKTYDAFSGKGYRLGESNYVNTSENTICADNLTDNELLAQAIAISLEEQQKEPDMDEIKRKRLERYIIINK